MCAPVSVDVDSTVQPIRLDTEIAASTMNTTVSPIVVRNRSFSTPRRDRNVLSAWPKSVVPEPRVCIRTTVIKSTAITISVI